MGNALTGGLYAGRSPVSPSMGEPRHSRAHSRHSPMRSERLHNGASVASRKIRGGGGYVVAASLLHHSLWGPAIIPPPPALALERRPLLQQLLVQRPLEPLRLPVRPPPIGPLRLCLMPRQVFHARPPPPRCPSAWHRTARAHVRLQIGLPPRPILSMNYLTSIGMTDLGYARPLWGEALPALARRWIPPTRE